MKPRPSPFVRILLPSSAWLLVLAACSSDSSSGNHPPLVTIDSPFTGSSFAQGDEVELEGSALDPEDGALGGASLSWVSDLDGALGTGPSLTTTALSLGTHGIRLTATDSGGASGSADVHVRIAASPGSTPRAGEMNPYAGRMQRTPAKLDDELILVGRSGAEDQELLGIVDVPVVRYEFEPSSTPVEPRITARLDGLVPVAAAAGRPLGSSYHQAAVVQRTSAAPQFRLELLGLIDPGDDRLAEYIFQPPFPGAALDVAVADLDAFEETTGAKALEPPEGMNDEYHDEVALAFPDTLGGDLVARVEVLSFEDVALRRAASEPVPGPTSVTTTFTTQAMHPASRVVVRHGDSFYGTPLGPHLSVAYVDTLKRIVLDVFEYRHTRADVHAPDPRTDARSLEFVMHVILSTPLADSVVAAGGWDVVVGSPRRLGMDLVNSDVVLEVHNAAGSFVQSAWLLDGRDGDMVPDILGQETGEFARVEDGVGGEIGLSILPDSRIRIALGRIVDRLENRCEALGLFVLADTNRGAVVQSMSAFVEDPDVGDVRFGPVNEKPAWPGVVTIRNRPETVQTTRTSLVAGGFVSERNGLIDYRGMPSGVFDEFAEDCDNVNSAPYLGPMPSFYVADPAASELHAVTLSLGAVGGGGLAVTVPMDAALDQQVILLAADAEGDAAYYGSFRCFGSPTNQFDCRRLFLGDAELHYVIEDIETKSVLLQQPPKHVDYLPALGGIVDVSMRDGFMAEFVQTDQASGSLVRKLKTDWSVGERLKIGIGEPKAKDYESSFEMSLDYEHRSVQEGLTSTETRVSLTQSTGAVDDDVVWGKQQTIDFWRFPAQGGKSEDASPRDPSELPEDAYIEISIPDEPRTIIGAGTLNEGYQPTHMVGNILSYPTFAGDVDDLGDLFGFLGDYVPSDEDGTRRCQPLADGNLASCLIVANDGINDFVLPVAEVLAGDDFVGGQFEHVSAPIDVAEVLQVGGIAYSVELEFESTVKNGLTVTNNDTIKVDVTGKVPLEMDVEGVPFQFAEIEGQLRAAASFENARVSENALGSKAKIALRLPADIPLERSYQIRPSFGFTPGGGLRLAYQVNTGGAAATFWERNYSAPDPALHMPHRIVRTREGFRLGTDRSRDQVKGFFVRDGEDVDPFAPERKQGELLTEVPRAGDPVQLQVQVTNLSVATAATDLAVAFSVQVYAGGEALGEPIPIGAATIDFLPHRGQFPDVPQAHIASAYVLWDTAGFGPPPGQALITYLVRVTLDPDDRIPGETHELFDRFHDPLLGPTGQTLDPLLEKAQNNTGWALVRIAPSLAQEARAGGRGASSAKAGAAWARAVHLQLEGEQGLRRGAPLRGRVDEPLRLSLGLRSEQPVLDYGRLQVFDGDPEAGGLLILSRTVQGISDVTSEEFVWRPKTPGRRVLHAVFVGTRAGDHPALQIPVIIED